MLKAVPAMLEANPAQLKHSWTPAITWDISFLGPTFVQFAQDISESTWINFLWVYCGGYQGLPHYWNKRVKGSTRLFCSYSLGIHLKYVSHISTIWIRIYKYLSWYPWNFHSSMSYSIYMYLLDISGCMYIYISYAFVSVSVCVSVYVYDEIIYSMFVQTWGYAYSHIYIYMM